MASLCRCGQPPQACTCDRNTPFRNSAPQYYAAFPAPGPQSPWAAQSYPPPPPPMYPFGQSYSPTRGFTFQNSFQSTFSDDGSMFQSPTPFGAILGNVTNFSPSRAPANPPAPAKSTRRRKRRMPGDVDERVRTRQRTGAADASDGPAVFGVGPATEAPSAMAAAASTSVSHPALGRPTQNLHSVLDEPAGESNQVATDVWYFCRGVHSEKAPVSLPENENPSSKRPDRREFSHLVCRLCLPKAWTAWKNVDGQTVAIRTHLQSPAHIRLWRELVLVHKLKGWESLGRLSKKTPGEREEYTKEGLHLRMAKWTAAADQPLDVFDCEELRDLLLFIGPQLEDEDIPHRTKLTEIIVERFQVEYKKMVAEMQSSPGRISFTKDVWSRENLDSHLGITGHYIVKDQNGRLELRTRLVGFRRLEGSHSGDNLGDVFMQVVSELGCLHKISMITCDNASNNDTAMRRIQGNLAKLGISFCEVGNRIRCVPHVFNISVKAGCHELTEMSAFDEDIDHETHATIPQELCADPEYWDALQRDPISAARRLVTACRASGQRRDNLEKTIEVGNEAGGFGDPAEILWVVGLLKDVDTRWSATFLMIDRLLEQYLAVDKFLSDPKQVDIADLKLDEATLRVLRDIRRFLHIMHVVQEIVSGERTPTLSIVLPLYEKLIIILKALAKDLVKISHAIQATIDKLEQYLKVSRLTRIYALAMVLNPTIKLEWMKKNWSKTEHDAAKAAVRGAMLEFRKERRSAGAGGSPGTDRTPVTLTRRAVQTPSASKSARSITSGMARLNALVKSISDPSVGDSSNSASPPNELTAEQKAEAERLAMVEDERIVDDELAQYEAEGLMDENHPGFEDLDLLQHWESEQFRHPHLFRVALDVLPAQASAVPCERIFSSSKQTDASRRNSLSSNMMEILQILKFIYRQDRISFSDGLVATEEELSVIDIDPKLVDELIGSGRIDELTQLVDSSWGNSPTEHLNVDLN